MTELERQREHVHNLKLNGRPQRWGRLPDGNYGLIPPKVAAEAPPREVLSQGRAGTVVKQRRPPGKKVDPRSVHTPVAEGDAQAGDVPKHDDGWHLVEAKKKKKKRQPRNTPEQLDAGFVFSNKPYHTKNGLGSNGAVPRVRGARRDHLLELEMSTRPVTSLVHLGAKSWG